MDQIIDDFNSTLLCMAENIANVCKNTIVGNNIDFIKKTIKNSNNRTIFIETFVTKILQYKNEIYNKNDSFFLNKSYDDDFKNIEGGSKILNYIFEFKSIWKSLNPENKDIFIDYMKILCELSQEYFLMIDA
jgi:hypothetical protein